MGIMMFEGINQHFLGIHEQKWIESILYGDKTAINKAVDYVCEFSFKCVQSGRTRQRLCNAMKHVNLDDEQKKRLVSKFIELVEDGKIKREMREFAKLIRCFDDSRVIEWIKARRKCKNTPIYEEKLLYLLTIK